MIECISLLCEILAVLVVIHSLLKKKFVLNSKVMVFLLINVLTFCLINLGFIPRFFQFVVYIAAFIYFKFEFMDESIVDIFLAFLCTLFIVSGIEVLIYIISEILEIGGTHYINIVVNILILTFALLLVKIFDLGKLYQFVTKNKHIIGYIITGAGLLTFTYILSMKFARVFSFLEMILFVAIYIIVIVCFWQWKMQRDIILMKEREIKWLEQCNASFDQLITDVRSRQHEFNNRMDAICGLQYSCKTYDELVKHINEYTDMIAEDNRFNKLLTMECPPIVKGFLYYRFCRAYEYGFEVDYKIGMNSDIDFSVVYDATEIVGILFDNACEAQRNSSNLKSIFVSINQTEEGIKIFVENMSEYIPYKELSLFVRKGYSTKDNNRGYGLYNVKKLVRKYNGEITINNVDKGGENWLQIIVELLI